MADTPHQCWTSRPTSYLRNLDEDDLAAEAFAVNCQKPPKRNDNGATSLSVIVPMLLVTGYAAQAQEIAERVAGILNTHWDSHGQPDARDARIGQLEAALAPFAKYKTVAELANDPAPLPWSEMGLKDRLAAIAANKDRRDAEVIAAREAMAAAPSAALPQDVITLVIAAREAWEMHGASGDELDRALERFAEHVPFQNQPGEVPQ